MKHGITPSKLAWRDLVAEALSGLLARPVRTGLTTLGTVLGVGAFVAVLGLTATAGGQISKRFTALTATEVVVEDVGQVDRGSDPALALPAFPADADARIAAIDGVRSGGVWWPVRPGRDLPVTGVLLPGQRSGGGIGVTSASPGLLMAVKPTVLGRLFDAGHDQRADAVVVLGSAAASRLGVSGLSASPAIFIDGIPFTVIGIIQNVERNSDLLFTALVPRHTAESLWGPPAQGQRAKMLIETRLGAAQVVASQAAVALRPDMPSAFKVTAPPDPRSLHDAVTGDLAILFLLLAGVCLVIGAVGIANTTMVAVLERVPEIGLRRALGARPRHIAMQFLAESGSVGFIGGLAGTALGVVTVVTVAAAREWTAILEPLTVLPAPLLGALIGVLAGAYPARRASDVEPAEALRR